MNNSHLVREWSPVIKTIIINGTKTYKEVLTKKQYRILNGWMMGSITQKKIATKYGIHQTNVHKTLFGNIEYHEVGKKRYVWKKNLRKYKRSLKTGIS